MPPDITPAQPRPYRGVPQDERRALRRSQLIGAAIAVYGERGYRQATVKAVCEAAGLTERYFYESFANSEELLLASYNAVTSAVHGEMVAAAEAAGGNRDERGRAMLQTYFAALQRDPRSARVFLVEIRGVSRAVDKAFDASLRSIGEQVGRIVGAEGADTDPLLLAGLVGGVMHMALRWIEDDYAPGIDAVTDAAMRLGDVLVPRAR
jgi:AcrR family transcriptional regulator